MEMVCPVDASGKFTPEVSHFKGMYIKVSDIIIHHIHVYCGTVLDKVLLTLCGQGTLSS